MSSSLWPYGLQPARLLCPWDFPGKNTGVGCPFLLQGIFLSQGLKLCLLCLLRWQADSLPLCHLEAPINISTPVIKQIVALFIFWEFPLHVDIWYSQWLFQRPHNVTWSIASPNLYWTCGLFFCCTSLRKGHTQSEIYSSWTPDALLDYQQTFETLLDYKSRRFKVRAEEMEATRRLRLHAKIEGKPGHSIKEDTIRAWHRKERQIC